jgi:hypothetical protein
MENFRREAYPHEVLTGLDKGVYELFAPDEEATKVMFQVTAGYITFVMGTDDDIPDPDDDVGFRVDVDSGIIFVELLHGAHAKVYVPAPYVVIQAQWGK